LFVLLSRGTVCSVRGRNSSASFLAIFLSPILGS
jgi:hypothetical protein